MLTMAELLRAVDEHGMNAVNVLAGRGFHRNAVLAAVEKAASRGWLDYGVSANYPWITPEGRQQLSDLAATVEP